MKKIRFRSVQVRIAVMFSAVILVTISTFILLAIRFSFAALRDTSLDYTRQLIAQVDADIDSYIRYVQDLSQIIASSSDIATFFKAGDVSEAQMGYLRTRVTQLIDTVTLSRSDIANIVLVGMDGRSILNKGNELNPNIDPSDEGWFKQALKAEGELAISSSHVQNVVQDNYGYVVSLSRLIIDKETNEPLAVLLIDLNYSIINDLAKRISLGKRGYIFIVDNTGDIVYHPQQQLIYSDLKREYIDRVLASGDGSFESDDQDRRIYTVRQSKYTGWKVVGVTYTSELAITTPELQTYYTVATVLFLLLSFGISYYLAHRISRPIKQLESSMRQVEVGNFDTKVMVAGADEIGSLGRTFNIMTQKIKDLINQNVLEHELKRKYELRALQNQINPHFLYNTLDSIIWMAQMQRTEEVVQMTAALARLFRISISRDSELISFRNELEYLENYLVIQKMRYEDKLNYEINFDREIMDKCILKLLLQPLVENAIYHGLKNKPGGGVINITGGFDGEDHIRIQIADTGAGMSENTLKNIFSGANKKRSRGGNVGLSNVNSRIKLAFGESYGLSISSELGEGTVVSVELPVIEQEA